MELGAIKPGMKVKIVNVKVAGGPGLLNRTGTVDEIDETITCPVDVMLDNLNWRANFHPSELEPAE